MIIIYVITLCTNGACISNFYSTVIKRRRSKVLLFLFNSINRWKVEHGELFENLLSNITDIGLRMIIIEREHKI